MASLPIARDVWPVLAHQWSLLGPPLRPSPEDVAIVERVARAANARRPLLLGVTPEIATCAWPEGAALTAVDVAVAMIAQVWPSPPGSRALRGDWRALPLEDGSVDFVTGDGVLTLLRFPDDAAAALREVRRVLAPEGHFVVRAFIPPATREEPEAVAADLLRGAITNFHVFKWRLNMALHRSVGAGVKLGDVWTALGALLPDARAIFARLGWSDDLVATFDVYRDSPVTYWFPTARDIIALAEEHFDHLSTSTPRYELGERCPTLVFRARPR